MASQLAHSAHPNQQADSKRSSVFWFAAATLLGAFLVFQVQPVISKCVLPWFGGTPAVWTTCMLFFQLLLFGGYAYAHLLRTLFRPAIQGGIHLSLLSAAVLMLPIEPSADWKPTGTESPTAYLLAMLAAHVGLPYFVLSSTGPLIQAWMSYRDDSERVYRLYALSNAGSLAALLSYPFLVEPVLSVSNQSVLWSLMFCGFVLLQGVVAIGLSRISTSHQSNTTLETNSTSQPIRNKRRIAWVALPAFASTMLLVVTNHVCQNVAVIPFLWVLPLSLYLISFIICFDSPQWYKPKLTAALTLMAISGIEAKEFLPGSTQLIAEIASYMVVLLGVCLLCHGEVARLKPRSDRLTQYYMLLSAGGAIGGLIVAILCPILLRTHLEHSVSMSLVTTFAFVMLFTCRGWLRTSYDWSAIHRLRLAATALLVAPFLVLAITPQDETIASERNFFGVLQVSRDDLGVRLIHGSTIHGMQRLGEHAMEPTTYYGRGSGIGRAITSLQDTRPALQVGVVGLGCGVLAAYGREADQFDMIEINPAVIEIANQHFSFLHRSPAVIRTHLGDGRLVLERMRQAEFDLLVLDAFSSDAIPAHLLTREAMALYGTRISPTGMLAIHVSNNHLDLVPLVHRLSHDAGLDSRAVHSKRDPSIETQHATWVLLTRPGHPIWDHHSLRDAEPATARELKTAPIWTDQHHNLVSVLRFW